MVALKDIDPPADTSENSLHTSEQFNAPDADISFKSSDNVLFSLHRKYLTGTTGALLPMEIEPGKTAELTEDSSTLGLLFQFVYPQRHPNLSDTPYEVIAPLAEAAEKYEVFAAINICQIRMVNLLPAHAEGIMAYAAKYGYYDIVDMTAPRVVSLPLGEVVRLLPQHLVVPWVLYRQQWYDILLLALSSRPNTSPKAKCDNCSRCTPRPISPPPGWDTNVPNEDTSCFVVFQPQPVSSVFGMSLSQSMHSGSGAFQPQPMCDKSSPEPSEQLNLNLSVTSLSSLDELIAKAKSQTFDNTETREITSWLENIKAKVDGIQKFSIFI